MEAHYWSFQSKHGGNPFTPPYFSLNIICGGQSNSIPRIRSLEKKSAISGLISIEEAHFWSFQLKFDGNQFTWRRKWNMSIPRLSSLEKRATIFWLISIVETHYWSYQSKFGETLLSRIYFSLYMIWDGRGRSIPKITSLDKRTVISRLVSIMEAHYWSFQARIGKNPFTRFYISLYMVLGKRIKSISKISSLEKRAAIFRLISIVATHYWSFQSKFDETPFTRAYFSLYTMWGGRSRSNSRIESLEKRAAISRLNLLVEAKYWLFQSKYGGKPFIRPCFSLYMAWGGRSKSIFRITSLKKITAISRLISIVEAH